MGDSNWIRSSWFCPNCGCPIEGYKNKRSIAHRRCPKCLATSSKICGEDGSETYTVYLNK